MNSLFSEALLFCLPVFFYFFAARSCCVGDTLACALEGRDEPLPTPGVAPPTLAMVFGVNTGPLQGKEGTHVTGVCLSHGYGWASALNTLYYNILLWGGGIA